jgi:signal peptidase I
MERNRNHQVSEAGTMNDDNSIYPTSPKNEPTRGDQGEQSGFRSSTGWGSGGSNVFQNASSSGNRICIRRRPLVAALLSFLVPGLGQLYNGRLPKTILFFAVGCVIDIVPSMLLWARDFRGFVLMLTLPAAFRLVVAAEAFWQARQLGEIQLRQYTRWYVYVAAVGVAVLLAALGSSAIGTGGLAFINITAPSMMPTLEIGDRIVVDSNQYTKEKPKRGDIVVFAAPGDRKKEFIKRVVGLPGERLSIEDKAVLINGKPLFEPYATHLKEGILPYNVAPRDNLGAFTIPAGQVFVMGDNRDYSNDSRFFGPIRTETIVAKALYIFWARDKSRIGKRVD